MAKPSFENLSDEQKLLVQTQGERLVGFTVERAGYFLAQSRAEHPEKDEAWHKDDAVGKFKHFLRHEHGWGGAVDAAWPHLKPFAVEVVEIALSVEARSE